MRATFKVQAHISSKVERTRKTIVTCILHIKESIRKTRSGVNGLHERGGGKKENQLHKKEERFRKTL